MTNIKEGNIVSIFFEAKLETGEIVLQSKKEEPFEITVGDGSIPKSVENALIDMQEGETKTITLEPIEAFGLKLDELVIELPKEGFGPETDLIVGSRVAMKSPEGKQFIGTIIDLEEEKVKVDFNHPLAGKSLVFTLTVVNVKEN